MNYNSENSNITNTNVISKSETKKKLVNISYKQEILRKAIHLISLNIPIIYIFVSRNTALLILFPMAFTAVLIDILSKYDNFVRKFLYLYFSQMLRSHEKNRNPFILNGASWVLIAAFTTVLLFPKVIAIISFMILIISDIAAALIGRRFGKHKILDKSLEGTSAFIISGWIVVWIIGIIFQADLWFYIAGYTGALVGGIIELLSSKLNIDDNLSIPISVGITMSIVNIISVNINNTGFLNLFI